LISERERKLKEFINFSNRNISPFGMATRLPVLSQHVQ